MGIEGLNLMLQAKAETGLPIVTELVSPAYCQIFEEKVDLVQIGARNMQNFELLKEAGKMSKPILLKRGLCATCEEWLMAAEYIMSEGNQNVILCERGIRTSETYTRNTLDVSAIPVIKQKSHLPVIVDPSHSGGYSYLVEPLSMAAIAAGADGLIIEVHNDPAHALCDGQQSLTPAQFGSLMDKAGRLVELMGKHMGEYQ
jgi:3-deoxy-7-phosphoheptulonate synthase